MSKQAFDRYHFLRDSQEAGGALSIGELQELDALKKSDPLCAREEEIMDDLRALRINSGEGNHLLVTAALEQLDEEERVVPLRPEFAIHRESCPPKFYAKGNRSGRSRRMALLALAAAAPAAAMYFVVAPSSAPEPKQPPVAAKQELRPEAEDSASESSAPSPLPAIIKEKEEKKEQNKPEQPSKSRPAATPPLKDLLAQAREAVGAGAWRKAAAAYGQIRQYYPGSIESRTVLVALGQLQLDRLGQPASARRSFELYLKGGGSLSHEARYGRIRSLRALGNKAGEKAALKDFLTHHKSSADAPSLRRRLDELTD